MKKTQKLTSEELKLIEAYFMKLPLEKLQQIIECWENIIATETDEPKIKERVEKEFFPII